MPAETHSQLGASCSPRWMQCPGSVAMAEGAPDDSSVYADEGTAAHALAEMCLRQGRDAADFVGLSLKGGRRTFEATGEMAEHVQVYLDVVRAELAENPGAVLHVERQFALDWLLPDMFGTCDAIVEVPFVKLVVVDFKYGAGIPVAAEGNSQLRYYGLGAAYGEDYDRVEMVIVQPRAAYKGGPVRRETLSLIELETWGRGVLLPAAMATREPDAPLNAGPWCKSYFCPAHTGCPAMREAVMEAAELAFDPVEADDLPAISLPSPADLPPEKLARVRQLAEILGPWIKAVVAHTDELVKSGGYLPGYKAVQGKPGNRRYADEEAAGVVLLRYLKKDAYQKPKYLTVTQAEKALKDAIKAGALADEALTAFNACVVKPAGGLVVVPEADPREPAKMEPEKAFAPVEDFDEADGF